MTDSTKPQSDKTTEMNSDLPEGFDKPTGPFANRQAAASYADEPSTQTQDTPSEGPETVEIRDTTAGSPQDVERIAELESQLAEMKDQALRAMAETENMRRRTERERADMQKYAITSFAKELLNVSDNLRRALEAVPEESKQGNEELNNLLVGVEATERELLKIFEKKGIQKIHPLGEKFDPNFHEVMFEAPSEEHPAGTIFQVMEAGYVINDRLLRPARVGVSKGSPELPADGADHHIDTQA